MSLRNFKPRKVEIAIDEETTIEVRGLTLNDVAIMMETNRDGIQAIYEQTQAQISRGTMTDELAQDFALNLVQESPILAANIIALATDDHEAMLNALNLPLPATIDALTVIAGLTFHDVNSVKKFFANVGSLVRGLLPAATRMTLAAE